MSNLNNQAVATVTIVVTPTEAATVINTVAVSAASPDDPDLDNNQVTEQTVVLSGTLSTILYLPIISK